MTARTAKKAANGAAPATCPKCGLEFEDRDPATEPVYECAVCGAEGFDCCVPGNNAVCEDCED